MFVVVAILSALVSICNARPSGEIIPQNVVSVPPNCPVGQEYINGQCRDVWFKQNNINAANLEVINQSSNRNLITVPANCPPGQEFINGQCRDVWRFRATTPISTYAYKSQLELRGKRQTEEKVNVVDTFDPTDPIYKNVINVPNQCPNGYKPDALGICRQILD